MMLLNITVLTGKLHPLFVHLPIGFLIMAAIMQWLGGWNKYHRLRTAVPISLLLGAIAGLFSCITGYALSLEGGYNDDTLNLHMWMGIVTTITAFICWLISIKKIPLPQLQGPRVLNTGLKLIVLFITLAGHWGGTLTHGEGYLALNQASGSKPARKILTDIDQAQVFTDVVQPILQHKCGSCHNQNKMKGKLSLESFTDILKGGKHGEVVKPGSAAESEMIRRVLLDPSDKEFMPTDGKPALTTEERTIITWWIDAAFQKEDISVANASTPDSIRTLIANYYGAGQMAAAASAEPFKAPALNISAPALKEEVWHNLRQPGITIKQIHYNPDLLDVAIHAGNASDAQKALELLLPVKENISWLNISANELSDEGLASLSGFSNLQRLRLDKNPVSDKVLTSLTPLKNLESINLCFTKISPAALEILSDIPSLKTAYVWGTAVPQADSWLRQDSSLQVVAGTPQASLQK